MGAELLRTEVVSKWLMMDHRINQYFKKKTKFGFCSTSQEIATGRVHWSRYCAKAHGYIQKKMPYGQKRKEKGWIFFLTDVGENSLNEICL